MKAHDGIRGETVFVSRRGLAVTALYVVIGSALIWSRFSGINLSLWSDEIFSIEHYITPGPRAAFGEYGTNDHILFSVLAWLTIHLPGFGLSAYRLWAIVPFIAAVAIGGIWLHRRVGAAEGLLFTLLATASVELLILSTEARGYGLAFLAMTVGTIAAWEATASLGGRWLGWWTAAAVIGTCTLPTFVLAVVGMAIAMVALRPAICRSLLVHLIAAGILVGAWYAFPARALLHSTGQQAGAQLPWYAPVTGGASEITWAFLPPLNALTGAALGAPLLALGLLTARRKFPGLETILFIPTVITFAALTASRFYFEPRFASFLLSPLLICAALGIKTFFGWATAGGRARRATLIPSLVAALLVLIVFGAFAARHARMPQEANREAAAVIAAAYAKSPRPVIMNVVHPEDIGFYLRPIQTRSAAAAPPCSKMWLRSGVIFVQQPFEIIPVDTSCLRRAGAKVTVVKQWDRGSAISVWDLAVQ